MALTCKKFVTYMLELLKDPKKKKDNDINSKLDV